jgi:muramoyltetrapeptide carboxypeptidase
MVVTIVVKPKKPKIGDKVALIGTSGGVLPQILKKAIKNIEALGFNVEVGKSCYLKHGYFSGKDQVRADDVNLMFKRDDIKAIFVIRGGYGCHRLMELIDFELIKKKPKFFCGYSDVTALHIELNQRCNLITYHTPMPGREEELNEYSAYYYKKAIFEDEFNCKLKNPIGRKMKTLVSGKAYGPIIGGNLTLVTSTLGTNYEINTKNKILLLEEVGEEPYKIDGKLNQLKNAGKLKNCLGIILGDFTRCSPHNLENSLTINNILEEIVMPLKIPTITNVAIGHCDSTMSIPLGANVNMDSDKKEIVFGR